MSSSPPAPSSPLPPPPKRGRFGSVTAIMQQVTESSDSREASGPAASEILSSPNPDRADLGLPSETEIAAFGNVNNSFDFSNVMVPSAAYQVDPFFAGLPTYVKTVAQEMGLDAVKWGRYLSRLQGASSHGELLTFNALLAMKLAEEALQLRMSDAEKRWAFTRGLRKNATNCARIFVTSPRASAYRPKNAADTVYNVMLLLKFGDMPSASNLDAQDEVKEHITKKLSDHRHVFKDKCELSLQPNSPLRNIANLTEAIVSTTTGVKPTLALLMRVAFIRWHVLQYADALEQKAAKEAAAGERAGQGTLTSAEKPTAMPKKQKAVGDAFWKKVDHSLQKMKVEATSTKHMDLTFTEIYEMDKVEYGRPEDTKVVLQDARDCPSHINAIFDAARDVTNVQSLDDDPLEDLINDDVPPAKRRRTG
ncbi:hypothetical protein FB107DRAFT_246884 [Schizophyllum commune]